MSGNDMRKLMESLKPVNEMAGCGCSPECKCGGDCGGHCGDANCPCECGVHTGVGTDQHGVSINENVGGMDRFTQAYLEAALWSSTDNANEQGGEPLDKNYDITNIDSDTLAQMKADCVSFQEQAWDEVSEDVTRAGHDFWLTRNGHGAGFWDGHWPEPAATKLTELSKTYGEFDLYVGDDGIIYGSPLAESMDEVVEEDHRSGSLASEMTMMPDQRSVNEQLIKLVGIANKHGLYDAADWIESRI